MKSHLAPACLFACILTTNALARHFSPPLPSNVDLYATSSIGDGQQCLVGAQTDDDGTNEMPVTYLEKAPNTIIWHASLPLPPDTYQARATHCTGAPTMLYVLVQGDTQFEQSLSQTLLEIIALNRATGAVAAIKPIDIPNINEAHTTWVEDGSSHFLAQGNDLIVAGKYDLLSNRGNPQSFSLKIAQNLNH